MSSTSYARTALHHCTLLLLCLTLFYVQGSDVDQEARSPNQVIGFSRGPDELEQTNAYTAQIAGSPLSEFEETKIEENGRGHVIVSPEYPDSVYEYNALIQVHDRFSNGKPTTDVKYIGTGILIASNSILTSGGTCYDEVDEGTVSNDLVYVVVGAFSLSGNSMTQFVEGTSGNWMRVGVEQVILHPYFQLGPLTFSDDICILKLSSDVLNQQHVQPAQLGEANTEAWPGQKVFTFGWGMINTTHYPSTLQGLETKLTECFRFPIFEYSLKTLMWCTKAVKRLRSGMTIHRGSPCRGDNGGPLIALVEDDEGRFQRRVIGMLIQVVSEEDAVCGDQKDLMKSALYLNICAPEVRTWIGDHLCFQEHAWRTAL